MKSSLFATVASQTPTDKLDYFYKMKRVPHIIFHGPAGSGKRTLVHNFIYKIYDGDKQKIKNNVLSVNCSHGKGIKFVREELKFFAKANINSDYFKSIVLLNADSLTIDAQSALRRCIEVFSHNTRFFIIVENKRRLLTPILSRFCEIYVPECIVNNTSINLHKYLCSYSNEYDISILKEKREYITTQLTNTTTLSYIEGINVCNDFYSRGISALDIIDVIKILYDETIAMPIIIHFYKHNAYFRCEKMLMFYVLCKII
jgi:DNA polymerase III delta prime subunit